MRPEVVSIVWRVANHFGMTAEELLNGQCNKRPAARRVAMHLASEWLSLTQGEVAYEFDRSISTTGDSLRRVKFDLVHRPNGITALTVSALTERTAAE